VSMAEVKPHPLCIAKAYYVGKELAEALSRLELVPTTREEVRKRSIDLVRSRIKLLVDELEELIKGGCFPKELSEKARSAVELAREALRLVDTNPSEALKKLSYVESILDDVTHTMYAY